MTIRLKPFFNLLWGMVARDLRGRYLGSFGGKAWNVIYPLAMIAVYTLVFSEIIRFSFPTLRGPLGYVLYLCSGLLPWLAIDDALRRSTSALVSNFALIQNLPFRREILVLQVVASAAVSLCISLSLLLVLELFAGIRPGPKLLLLPAVVMLQVLLMLGPALLLSVLHVYLRDTEQMVSIFLSFVFWLIPIVYVPGILPDGVAAVVRLNPLTHLVAIYRAVLLPYPFPGASSLLYLAGLAVLGLVLGVAAYRRLGPWVPDNL